MAVTVLFGKSGGGKTTQCFAQMKEWAGRGGKAMLIVPDQASYSTERRLAGYMDGKGFMGMQVSGFSRLAYRVFLERSKEHAFLSDLARNIILQRLLRRWEGEFSVLRTAASQDHFSETAARFIDECRSFCISPDMLAEAASRLEGQTLGRKLKDMALLYEKYMTFLQDRFGNADDMLTLLAKEIPAYSFIQGARIWIDGFLWFTPQQMRVLQAIESAADHVTITLPMDGRLEAQSGDSALFHRPYVVYHELRRLFPGMEAEFAGHGTSCEWIDDFFCPSPRWRDTPAAGLFLTEWSSRTAEMDAVARRILSLCRQGYRYRDMLILSRTGDAYYHMAEQVFAKYGIPFFSDYRRPMTAHPVVEAILSLLAVFCSGWSYEPLFGLLKTDLFPLSRSDADELENYCLEYGIQGYHWLSSADWTYGRRPYLEERGVIDEKEEAKLQRINDIRRRTAALLMPCWRECQDDHTLTQWCTLLYQWLDRLQVPQTLRCWKRDDEAAGRTGESKEHEQVWKRIIQFLDEIVRLCGGDVVSLQEFSRIISDGLSELKFSLIPPTLDHVMLTTVERGYTMQAPIVFLCGLNDGVFPKSNGEEGVLSDAERCRLSAMGIRLGPDSRFRSFQERFLFYLAATRASEELHLSYVLSDEDGRAMEPSPWVRQLEEKGYVHEAGHERGTADIGTEELITSVPSSLSWLPVMMRRAAAGEPVGDVWWALYDWALLHGWRDQTVQMLKGLFYRNEPQQLSPAVVRRLYAPDGVLRGSVTKFEQYRRCPFAYFSRYGLALDERPVYHFSAPDLGMLVHGALRRIGDKLLAEKKQWRDLPDGDIPDICREETEALAPYVQHDILMSNAYFMQIKERLIRTLTRTVRRLREFSAVSDFRTEGLERSFGRRGSSWEAMEFTLEDGLKVVVGGQIDRIDAIRADGRKYVAVIDYKSGRKELKLLNVVSGLDLQLLTYMYVALANIGPDAVPAAVLYCYVRDDMTLLDYAASDEEKQKEYGKKSKFTGFYLDDGQVMKYLDTSMTHGSEFLDISLKDDGTLKRGKMVLFDERQWHNLLKMAERQIQEIAAAIDSGNIAVYPVRLDKDLPCRYCPYHAVCAFDEQLQGTYHVIASMRKDELMKKLDHEGGSAHGLDSRTTSSY